MAVKKGNKALIWTTVSILVICGGIGLYFLLKKPKEEESSEDTGVTEDKSTSGSGSSKSESVKIDKPDWVDTKKFQTWMDENHPYFYKDTDGKYKNFCKATTGYERVAKVCGGWGQQTQKAWNNYGKKYAEFVGEKISNIKGVRRIRLGSVEPIQITNEFKEILVNNDRSNKRMYVAIFWSSCKIM